MFDHLKFKKSDKNDHLIHRDDILHGRSHGHPGSTFSEKEVNIVLLIILAVIALLFWVPLAELIQ